MIYCNCEGSKRKIEIKGDFKGLSAEYMEITKALFNKYKEKYGESKVIRKFLEKFFDEQKKEWEDDEEVFAYTE